MIHDEESYTYELGRAELLRDQKKRLDEEYTKQLEDYYRAALDAGKLTYEQVQEELSRYRDAPTPKTQKDFDTRELPPYKRALYEHGLKATTPPEI